MADDDSTYELLVEFDSDDEEFRRGWEAGKMWEGLKAGTRTFDVHADNAEMAMRIGESVGLPVRSEPINDDYVTVVFG